MNEYHLFDGDRKVTVRLKKSERNRSDLTLNYFYPVCENYLNLFDKEHLERVLVNISATFYLYPTKHVNVEWGEIFVRTKLEEFEEKMDVALNKVIEDKKNVRFFRKMTLYFPLFTENENGNDEREEKIVYEFCKNPYEEKYRAIYKKKGKYHLSKTFYRYEDICEDITTFFQLVEGKEISIKRIKPVKKENLRTYFDVIEPNLVKLLRIFPFMEVSLRGKYLMEIMSL